MESRNLLQLVTIHPTLVLFLIIAFVTGTFVQLSIIWSIIIIHELGHFLAARYFNWRIQSIVLWVFGGVMKTDEHTTRPLKEEIIVTLSGPVQHVIIYFVIVTLSQLQLLPNHITEQALYFNSLILFFNLLPIYPLDGGKITLFLLSYMMPYRLAYRSVLICSFVICMLIIIAQLFIVSFTLTAVVLFLFLVIELYKYWQDEYYTFIRFLLHRMYSEKVYPNVKNIYVSDTDRLLDVFNKFKRNKYHYIYVTPKFMISETEGLERYFYDKNYHQRVKDIFK